MAIGDFVFELTEVRCWRGRGWFFLYVGGTHDSVLDFRDRIDDPGIVDIFWRN